MYQPQTITTKDLIRNGDYPVYGANGVIGYYDKFNHEESQLLVTCRGATCGSVNISTPFSWINGNAMVVKPKHKDIDIRFVEFFFRGVVDLRKAITGAAQPQITRQSLSPIIFKYPSLRIQQKIVEKLDAIFAEIDIAMVAAEAKAKNTEALFQSYLTKMFESNTEDWVVFSFDELVADKQIGLVKNSEEQIKGGDYLYFKMNNITNDNQCDLSKLVSVRATDEEVKKYSLIRDDFLFNTRNSLELVGKVCVFNGKNDDSVLYNNNIMRVRFKQLANPYFILFAFSYRKVKEDIEKLKTGATNVAAIYYKDLKDLKLKLPNIEDQFKIVKKLNELNLHKSKVLVNLNSKKEHFQSLKQAILVQAFNGELVKD